MAIPVTKLSQYIKARINNDDLSAVEMVDRYLDLLTLYRRMRKKIDKDGVSITIVNGNQEYTKSHPHIADIKNINGQLVNLKKEIDQHIEDYKKQIENEKKNQPQKGLLD